MGYHAAGLRIIRYTYDVGTSEYVLRVEGRGGRGYNINLIAPRGAPQDVQGATLTASEGGRTTLRVSFDDQPDGYHEQVIRFKNPN